eukprot:jgi/Mesvir1/3047/Mv16454-RA.1
MNTVKVQMFGNVEAGDIVDLYYDPQGDPMIVASSPAEQRKAKIMKWVTGTCAALSAILMLLSLALYTKTRPACATTDNRSSLGDTTAHPNNWFTRFAHPVEELTDLRSIPTARGENAGE